MSLSKLLNLTRTLVVPDVETTGTDPEVDRIAQLAFQVHKPDGGIDEWSSLVDPGIPIPAETTEIHGIRDADMKACRICRGLAIEHPRVKIGELPWMTFNDPMSPDMDDPLVCGAITICREFKPVPRFAQIAEKLARGFVNCDFAGKNVRFDIRVLMAEFARAKVAWSPAGAMIVDADRLEAKLNPRDLSTLYRKYTGKELEGAHDAMTDVRATSIVLEQQLFQRDDDGAQRLPLELKELHELQFPGMIDVSGKFAFGKDGVPRFGMWGKFTGKRMDDPAAARPGRDGQSYWDWILGAAFPEDIKVIAREAKLGRYPVQK